MAGFAWAGSAPPPVVASAGTALVVTSASGCDPQEPARVSDSAPESVVTSTSMVGFAGCGPASAPVTVADGRPLTASLSGLADPCPHKPDGRMATPASLQ